MLNFPCNRRSIKTRFARKFHRALKKLNQQKRTGACNNSNHHSSGGGQMVKMAAYASLASAVGSRRAWSRALLWKIRNHRCGLGKLSKQKTKGGRGRGRGRGKENPNDNMGLEGLRKVVPGGEVMDTTSLFDETAHYIKCLTIQVQMMRKFVHAYSSG